MGLAGPGSRVFYFTTSLALSRNFLKFSISLRPTRVNLSTASSTTIPHPAEGAAHLCGRLPPSFSVSPFRPGILGLFGALLQPPAPEKKRCRNFWKHTEFRQLSLLFVRYVRKAPNR